MKSLQIAAIRHMPWLEDRHTLSDGRVCIRLTTAANEFDAVTLRHAFRGRTVCPRHRYADGAHVAG